MRGPRPRRRPRAGPDRRWSLGGGWSTLHAAVICFQRVADHRPPLWPDPAHPQQLHLDGGDGERGWRVYSDPAGHPYCLVREAQ